ncbi:hypothetical protein TorRG33x02_318490, partial [Trema orientale]
WNISPREKTQNSNSIAFMSSTTEKKQNNLPSKYKRNRDKQEKRISKDRKGDSISNYFLTFAVKAWTFLRTTSIPSFISFNKVADCGASLKQCNNHTGENLGLVDIYSLLLTIIQPIEIKFLKEEYEGENLGF